MKSIQTSMVVVVVVILLDVVKIFLYLFIYC